MVTTVGDTADPVIIHTSKERGAELTSSYEEEKGAFPLALDWARASCPTERISICFEWLFRVAHMTPSLFASD